MINYSHCSTFTLSPLAAGEIVFPGAANAPPTLGLGTSQPRTFGYVRSGALARDSWKAINNAWEPGDGFDPAASSTPLLPFRDYPAELRTPVDLVVKGKTNVLVLSSRNVLNEVTYQARIGGVEYRTARDLVPAADSPVLTVRRDDPWTLNFQRYADVMHRGAELDYLSGLVLVANGVPRSRAEIIAWCSDVAHNYFVNPERYFGVPAWEKLSDRWNELHTLRLGGAAISEAELTAEVDQVAALAGLPVGPHATGPALPHSVVAQRNDGQLDFLVLSTGLPQAGQFLSRQGYVQAIVLDQSGSVGPMFVDRQGKPHMLVSTSNYRPAGTCFLLIQTGGFLFPNQHFLIR